MRKKKISTFVLLFIIMMAVGVKANSIWDSQLILEKSEDSGELYNLMPTEVKKGDVISVKLILKDIKGWRVDHGNNVISWDKEAFELIETDGKYYRCLSNNIDSYWANVEKNSSIYLSYSFKNKVLNSKDEDIFELKFRVKNDVKDGIYEINSSWDGEFVIRLDDRDETRSAYGSVLKYQVGKTRLVSDYTKDNINPHSYIIGKYLFAQKSDAYDGQLTTEHIMLASKSIASDNKDDMIIYLKNARGQWRNAITNEPITPPSEFKIEYVDMKANYTENGVYSNTGDKNIVRLIQINENEAIVTIETYDVRVHGIANINNKIATLSINGKNYKITISDNELNLESNDSYIGKMKLYKKANYSVNDYYNDNYIAGGFGGPGPYPLFYLNSQHSGKYVYGNYELYLVRIGDTEAKFLLKEKGKTNFIFNEYLSGNEGGWFFDGEETTYFFNTDEKEYGINWENNQINVKCKGVCTNSYAGTYTKESTLSMEDVFHVWERNRVSYGVIFDEDNGYENYPTYIEFNKSINSDYGYWEPYKEGSVFVGWYLNNSVFDLDTPITKPITLEARYDEIKLPTPTLSVFYENQYDQENNLFNVTFNINADEYYNGFELYEFGDGVSTEIIGESDNGMLTIQVPVNQSKEFYARTYRIYNDNKRYSENSNKVIVNTVRCSVMFDSDGGSNISSQTINYGERATKPDNPTKEGYTFNEWRLNGVAYDFDTPVTGNITLVADWSKIYTVTFSGYTIYPIGNGLSSSVVSQYINEGQTASIPNPSPSRIGYDFVEWRLNGVAYDFNSPVTNNIELKSYFERNLHFNGIYKRSDNYLLKIYDEPDRSQFPDGKVFIHISNEDGSNRNSLTGFIDDDGNIDSYLGKIIKSNVMTVNFNYSTMEHLNGEYTRVSDYSMNDYYEERYAAFSSYLDEEDYNLIGTYNGETDTRKMYMFRANSDRVDVYFDNCGKNLFMSINTDGSLVYNGTLSDNKEYEVNITIDNVNNSYSVVEKVDGVALENSDIAGVYNFSEKITMEKIINNVQR